MAGHLSSEDQSFAIALRRSEMADVLPLTLAILVQKCFFSMQALLKNKGECVDNQNWLCKGDRVNLVNRSDQ
jgi:hypothetical protein